MGRAEVGELQFSEGELVLSARIGASALTKLFRNAVPAACSFEFVGVHGLGDEF